MIGCQYEVSMLSVVCYTMMWLMYHSRRFRHSPLGIVPVSVSSRIPTHIPDYVVGSTRTHWRRKRRCLLKWTSRLYIYSLFPCLLVPNVYTLIISQLPHVL